MSTKSTQLLPIGILFLSRVNDEYLNSYFKGLKRIWQASNDPNKLQKMSRLAAEERNLEYLRLINAFIQELHEETSNLQYPSITMASAMLYADTPTHDEREPQFVKHFFPDISICAPAIMVFGFGRCKELQQDKVFPWNRIQSIDSSLSPQLASKLWPVILAGPLFGPESTLNSAKFSLIVDNRTVSFNDLRIPQNLKHVEFTLTVLDDEYPLQTVDRILFPRTLKLPALKELTVEVTTRRSGQTIDRPQRVFPMIKALPLRSLYNLRSLKLCRLRIQDDRDSLAALFRPEQTKIENLVLDCVDISPAVLSEYFAWAREEGIFPYLCCFVWKVCAWHSGFSRDEFSDLCVDIFRSLYRSSTRNKTLRFELSLYYRKEEEGDEFEELLRRIEHGVESHLEKYPGGYFMARFYSVTF